MSSDTEETGKSQEESDSYGETSEEQPDESLMGSPMRVGRTANFLDSPSPLMSKSMLNSVSRKDSITNDIVDEFNPLRFLALQLKEFNEIKKNQISIKE